MFVVSKAAAAAVKGEGMAPRIIWGIKSCHITDINPAPEQSDCILRAIHTKYLHSHKNWISRPIYPHKEPSLLQRSSGVDLVEVIRRSRSNFPLYYRNYSQFHCHTREMV